MMQSLPYNSPMSNLSGTQTHRLSRYTRYNERTHNNGTGRWEDEEKDQDLDDDIVLVNGSHLENREINTISLSRMYNYIFVRSKPYHWKIPELEHGYVPVRLLTAYITVHVS